MQVLAGQTEKPLGYRSSHVDRLKAESRRKESILLLAVLGQEQLFLFRALFNLYEQ